MALASEYDNTPDEWLLWENKDYRFRQFQNLPYGQSMTLKISDLTPSQTKDGLRSAASQDPISAYYDLASGKIIICDGNHRYYDFKPDNDWNRKVVVKKTTQPL